MPPVGKVTERLSSGVCLTDVTSICTYIHNTSDSAQHQQQVVGCVCMCGVVSEHAEDKCTVSQSLSHLYMKCI